MICIREIVHVHFYPGFQKMWIIVVFMYQNNKEIHFRKKFSSVKKKKKHLHSEMNFLMNNLKKCFFVLIRMHFYTYLISYSLILNLLPYSPIVSCHNQTGCETVLKKRFYDIVYTHLLLWDALNGLIKSGLREFIQDDKLVMRKRTKGMNFQRNPNSLGLEFYTRFCL